MKHTKKNLGFSLIELLVVATIIIVLTTICLMSFRSAGHNSRDAKRRADMETVRQGLVLYRADLGNYPTGNGSQAAYETMAQSLVASDYMTDPYPRDPKDVAQNVYRYWSDGINFCVCANEVENTNNTSIPGACSSYATGDGYCVENPQYIGDDSAL